MNVGDGIKETLEGMSSVRGHAHTHPRCLPLLASLQLMRGKISGLSRVENSLCCLCGHKHRLNCIKSGVILEQDCSLSSLIP